MFQSEQRSVATLLVLGLFLFGLTNGAPVVEDADNEIDYGIEAGPSQQDVPSSTTEDISRVLARVYLPVSDRPGRMAYAGGVHTFRVGLQEDENKRLIEEYNYNIVRVEQNLPHTTQRYGARRPPSKD